MDHLIDPLGVLLKRYKLEVFLMSVALITATTSLVIFAKSDVNKSDKEISIQENKDFTRTTIVVDLGGAVELPDVYEVSPGARLRDVLILAGGLSADADRLVFARNFNLARILADQEKIYIPSIQERDEVPSTESNVLASQTSTKININTGTLSELDTLPGIGKVTGEKIISNRPYSSINDLLTKKVLGKSLFEKIKELIEP